LENNDAAHVFLKIGVDARDGGADTPVAIAHEFAEH